MKRLNAYCSSFIQIAIAVKPPKHFIYHKHGKKTMNKRELCQFTRIKKHLRYITPFSGETDCCVIPVASTTVYINKATPSVFF